MQPATVVFPTAFQAVSGTTHNQRLVVFPGQFSDLDPTPGADAGTQLLMDHGSYTVYYADSTTAGDATKPFIQESTASAGLVGGSPGVVLFRVKAPTRPASPTTAHRPVSSVSSCSTTRPRPLSTPHIRGARSNCTKTPTAPGSARWSPRGTDGRYFIQAVDGAGNTGVSQFKGNYYRADGTSPQAVAVVTDGTLGTSGWYVSPVQVSLYVAGVLATCRQRLHLLLQRHLARLVLGPIRRPAGDDQHHLHAARIEHRTGATRAHRAQGRWHRRRR